MGLFDKLESKLEQGVNGAFARAFKSEVQPVEIASGILQGYYTPIFTDIARHLSIADADVNWFEAAQLVVSALCVPLLARLADLLGGYRS